MLSPFVVEEHDDGKFYVHHQRKYNSETRQIEIGDLAYNKPFKSRVDAQMKANAMEAKTGVLW